MEKIPESVQADSNDENTRAERRHNERTTDSLLELSPVIMFAFDRDNYILAANSAFQAWVNSTTDQPIGQTLQSLLPEQASRHCVEAGRSVLQNHENVQQTITMQGASSNSYYDCTFYLLPLNKQGMEAVGVSALDVTERVTIEAALRASEERFRLAADAVPGLIYDLNFQSNQAFSSEGLRKILGYSSDEINFTYNWWLGQVHPEDRERVMTERGACMSSSIYSHSMEYRIRHRNGHYLHVQDNAVFVRDDNHTLTRVIGSAVDISHSTRIQAQLAQARERYQFLFDNSPIALWMVDSETFRILDVNRVALDLFGYTHEELTRLPAHLLHPVTEHDRLIDMMSHPQKELRMTGDWSYIRKDRKRFMAEIFIFPTTYHGRSVRIVAMNDISEQSAVREELQRSETRLRLAQQAGHCGAWDWDLLNQVIWWSPEYYLMFGLDPVNTLPTYSNWVDSIYPDDRQSTEQAVQEAVANGYAPTLEYRTMHPEKGIRWISVVGTLFHNRSGEPVRMVGLSMDVTERKNSQEEIEALNARLHRAIRETHHRVKNNLQSLSSLIDLQRLSGEKLIPSSTLDRFSQHIQLLAALHDMLTMESRANISVTAISLKATLDRLCPLLQQTASMRSILVEAEEISYPTEKSSSFALIVSELVSNAVKHGEGDIRIRLFLQQGELGNSECSRGEADRMGQIILEVIDDGKGFPADFDPVIRANTGLELILSLGRWDLGGQVQFLNRPEGGASVRVSFPARYLPASIE